MKKLLVFFVVLNFASAPAFAATKYARNVVGNWSADSTWSTTSGGSADTTKCTSADTCIIDSNTGTITVDVASTAGTLTFAADKTLTLSDTLTAGTVTHHNGATITLNGSTLIFTGDFNNSTNFAQYSGTTTFKIAGSANQLVNFNTATTRTISNPVLIQSTGGTVTFKSSYDNIIKFTGGLTYVSGTTDWSTNTVKASFLATQTIDAGGASNVFYDVTMGGGDYTFTLSSDVYVSNTFNIGNSTYCYPIINGHTIYIQKNFETPVIYNRYVSGTTTLEFSSSSSGSWTPNTSASTPHFDIQLPVVFAKSGGTLTVADTITLAKNATYTSGTIDWNGKTLELSGTSSQGVALGDSSGVGAISVVGTDVNLNSNLTAGSLTIGASKTFKPGSYTLTLTGNFTNSGTFTAGTSTVVFSGTSTVDGNTTFNNLSVTGTANFDDLDTFSAASCAGNGTYASDDATNQTDVNCTANTITTANCTRVANSGAMITSNGTITTCDGWAAGGATRGRMILMS